MLVMAARCVLALRFGHSFGSALFHPFAEAFLIALGLASWWRRRSGHGVWWKGRRYTTA
jgi:hypothetical protein